MNRITVPHSVLHSAWKFLSLKILINPEKNEAPKEKHFQGRAPVLTSSALKCFSHVAVQQLQLQRTTHLTLGRKKLVFFLNSRTPVSHPSPVSVFPPQARCLSVCSWCLWHVWSVPFGWSLSVASAPGVSVNW